MKYVKELVEELARFEPYARITDETGHAHEIDLSYRAPAVMCGIIFQGEEALKSKIADLEEESKDLERDYGRMKLCIEEIDEVLSNEPEPDEQLKKIEELVRRALK